MQKNRRLLFEYVDLKGAVSSQGLSIQGFGRVWAFKMMQENPTAPNPVLPAPSRHVPIPELLNPYITPEAIKP